MIHRGPLTIVAVGAFTFFLAGGFAGTRLSSTSSAKRDSAATAPNRTSSERRFFHEAPPTAARPARAAAHRTRLSAPRPPPAAERAEAELGAPRPAVGPTRAERRLREVGDEASPDTSDSTDRGSSRRPASATPSRTVHDPPPEMRELARTLPVERPPYDAWFFDSTDDLDDWEIPWQSEGLEALPEWAPGDPGYVRLWAPFSRANQAVQFGVSYSETEPPDLTGRTLKVRLKLAAGAGTGGVQLFAQSRGWVWVASGWTSLDALGEWTELSLELDAESGDFDPRAVLRVGIQLHSGAGSSFESNEVHIDYFLIE